MQLLGTLLAAAATLPTLTHASTAADWRSRSVYQLFTDRFALPSGGSGPCVLGERKYCGGTWKGITNKLQYIADMGFDAIWISPVVQNINTFTQYGQAYHGYWTQNINNLNSNFGSSSDLKTLVSTAHSMNMLVMIDLTVNSMIWPGSHTTVDYTTFASPFNSASKYHDFCWIDYTNATSILLCWLGDDNVALVDVKTQDSTIRSTYNNWIGNLQSTYNFDGMRIDALKSVEIDFFPGFQKASNMFGLGENYQADPTMLCTYQPSVDGLLNFPLYYGLLFAFNATGGGMQNLANLIVQNQGNCTDVSLFGNFIENHDLPRYAGITRDQMQRLNAIAFTFVIDGFPVAYYGQEQAFTGQVDPYNREALWTSNYDETNVYFQMHKTLNAMRKQVIKLDSNFLTTNTKVLGNDVQYIVLKKGSLLSLLFNDGSYGSNDTLTIANAGYSGGTKLLEVISGNTYTCDSSGSVTVKRQAGAPMILYPASQWPSTWKNPNLAVSVDTRTTATTTVTTTYVFATAMVKSDAVTLKPSHDLSTLIVAVSAAVLGLSAFCLT
ncbi:hypothetical protein PYCC9005_004622 [Savitreella phatthalungensis]